MNKRDATQPILICYNLNPIVVPLVVAVAVAAAASFATDQETHPFASPTERIRSAFDSPAECSSTCQS